MQPWVVLKFGGTSVSTSDRWNIIIEQVNRVLNEKLRPWIVISAISQVTNLLQKAIAAAIDHEDYVAVFGKIVQKHIDLLVDCKVVMEDDRDKVHGALLDGSDANDSALQCLVDNMQELKKILDGIRLTEEASARLKARVSAFGELMSTQVGLLILRKNGILNAVRLDARKLLVAQSPLNASEEDLYLECNVVPVSDVEKATADVDRDGVVLTQGFLASTTNGHTCLLGRGGSDTSATLFGVKLNAVRIEIWTDVHGLFTSDPRFVPEARLIQNINFRQAQELAAMGAKVLHPRCIEPAQWASIPIHIINTNDPNGERTKIMHSNDGISDQNALQPQILAVVRRCNMTLVTITSFGMCGTSGFLSKVFLPFEQLGISVDLIATSQYSISVTLDHIPGGTLGTCFQRLIDQLGRLECKVDVKHPCATVSIVGRHLRKSLYCMGDLLQVLQGEAVYLVSESAEDLNFSFVVDQGRADSIVLAMHTKLFNQTEKSSIPSTSPDLGSSWKKLKPN